MARRRRSSARESMGSGRLLRGPVRIVATAIGIAAFVGGFAFARIKFPFRGPIFILYLSTLMIPPQVTLIPTFIVVVQLEWIKTYQWMIFPIVAQGAFGTFMFRQLLLKMPNEL